jgi:hypothetical protein
VYWELVPDAPAGSYQGLVTDGTDLAAIVYVPNVRFGIVLRSGGTWEALPTPPGLSAAVVALSPAQLAVAGGTVPATVGLFDRSARTWTRLPDLPAPQHDAPVAVELVEGGPLVITQACRAFRWNGSMWETPGGWPQPSATSGCWRPFIRDGGRLFALAGGIFEYTGGRFLYPPQPDGPERVGVAVLPEGLVILQNGALGYADSLYVPGRSTPLSTPYFSSGPLVRHHGSLFMRTRAGPVRLGEGRWTLTRATASEDVLAWRPEGTYADAGGELYAASSQGLYVGRSSVRRLLPVAVEGFGVSGASFTSELRLANFGDADATAILKLRDPPGLTAGTTRIDVALPARRSVRIDDLIARFRAVNPGAPSTGSVRSGRAVGKRPGLLL